jgi:hypothetical protein
MCEEVKVGRTLEEVLLEGAAAEVSNHHLGGILGLHVERLFSISIFTQTSIISDISTHATTVAAESMHTLATPSHERK